MSDEVESSSEEHAPDVGEYSRQIEAHLGKVNHGQIIRIVGPAFELARAWAHEGVPVSVVCQGISRKADRHQAGRARRALRLEFCADDVMAVFGQWQRAVGVRRNTVGPQDDTEVVDSRRSSGSRHLERVMDRLAQAAGHLNRSDAFRDAVSTALEAVGELRQLLRGARGPARSVLLERLPEVEAALISAARDEAGPDVLHALECQAAEELSAFRTRLAPAAWQQSISLSVNRLLRERLGLPTLTDL